jgi:hypothetical protein
MIGYTVSAVQICANRRAAFLLAQALRAGVPPFRPDKDNDAAAGAAAAGRQRRTR